ncbi:MAG: Tm-1-like ATP-binding domain-containing protein [Deltaproteobacteria bacterium]|nr:Tm-1-like ATP-binding domain-containing protein [Deltaproteobacteria bacterium]
MEPLVNERGYELICFHANGTGGLAMEQMVSESLILGVLDLTLHEIADDIFGGYCRGAGETRLDIECSKGVPVVLAPGGLHNAVFSPHYPMPEKLKGRKVYYHDIRFCVRMEKEEMILFADIIAERLSKAKGPVKVLIPMRGFSEIDLEDNEFFDKEAPQVFASALKSRLKKGIEIEEVDANISELSFARKAVDSLFFMMKGH